MRFQLIPALCLGLLVPALSAQTSKPKTKLTLADARKIALAKEPGKIQEGELEDEKGIWIYSFDILRDGKTHEVNIDPNTGAILADTVESSADEAKEKAADAKSKSTPKP